MTVPSFAMSSRSESAEGAGAAGAEFWARRLLRRVAFAGGDVSACSSPYRSASIGHRPGHAGIRSCVSQVMGRQSSCHVSVPSSSTPHDSVMIEVLTNPQTGKPPRSPPRSAI